MNPPQHSERLRFPPGKRVSQEQAEVRCLYGSVTISREGRVRFSPRTFPGLPQVYFSVYYGAQLPDRTYLWSRSDYSIHASYPEKDGFFFLYVSRGRVVSACFNYSLTPEQMREAVSLLRKAGGGLERWIVPGLEYTRDTIAQMMASPGYSSEADQERGPKMLAVTRELLKKTRDLPVADSWKRARRSSRPQRPRAAT